MSRKANRKFKFAENEKLLCYQGPLIYEAKCLQAEVRNNDKHFYLVHYSGWNKHWDEWVDESRVLKYNEANLHKHKAIIKKYGADKQAKKLVKHMKNDKEKEPEKRKLSETVTTTAVNSSANLETEKKRVCLQSIEPETTVSKQSSSNEISHIVRIVIPKELQAMLTDDWDFIFRQKLLFHLPAKVTVHKILKKYLDEITTLSSNPSHVKEMVLGLQEYFNVMLGSQLLYKFERPQYGDMLSKFPSLTASQIYGAFHFLRFFVQLDSILPKQSHMAEDNMKLILFYVQDCLQFIKLHKEDFFDVSDYETAPAEYHRRAMT